MLFQDFGVGIIRILLEEADGPILINVQSVISVLDFQTFGWLNFSIGFLIRILFFIKDNV
jgi:hypothetical protein